MSLIAGTLSRLRDTAPRPLAAKPFTALSHHRSIKQHEKIGAVLGIENPFFRSAEDPNGGAALIDGKSCLNFAWCDYLSLGQHPELTTACKAAIDRYGTCISASRMVAGDTLLHRQLEKELAEFVGVDAALAFVSGHAANVSTIGTLMGKGDLIVHDAFVHNSAVVGMRLSGAEVRCFRHNNLEGLEAILRAERAKHSNALVVIEGLYSTEGDVPDLGRIIEIKERYGAWLMVDDAHGCGTLGRTGRGIAEHCGVDPGKVDIWMGTLSKAYASCGGYIAGSNALIEILKYAAPGFVFSVALPPSLTATALAALRLLKREPERVQRLHRNGALFLDEARALGLDTGRAIGVGMLPIMVGASTRAAKVVARMYERGINTSLIIYPGVPMNAGRLRFFVRADTTPQEISRALHAAGEELARC